MSARTTQKEIRNYSAIDITNYTFKMMDEFLKSKNLQEVLYSTGIYGCNGVVLIDNKTGSFYKITRRTTALFMI